jgi:hypothetical protein
MEGSPSQRARAVFTVSIASAALSFCGPVGAVGGTIAAIAAGVELTAIDRNEAPLAGRRMAVMGIVLGIVGAAIGALSTLFWMLILVGLAHGGGAA